MLRVELPAKLSREIRQKAKAAFPREEYCILLGTRESDELWVVEALYWPEDRADYATEDTVNVHMDWWLDAKRFAADNCYEILSDLHSHCYESDCEPDVGPSCSDLDYSTWITLLCDGQPGVMGICMVQKVADGKMRSKIRFWPIVQKIQTEIV